jgi:tetratricopeptide (TPR) repeat protein
MSKALKLNLDAKTISESMAHENGSRFMIWLEVIEGDYKTALGRVSEFCPELISTDDVLLPRAQMYADIYRLMGQSDLALAYYDSARTVLETRLSDTPQDPRVHSALGQVYAHLGRRNKAIEEGELAVELLPVPRDAVRGSSLVIDLAKIYVGVGEFEAAVNQLDYVLSIPSWISPPLLRVDPTWAPLRDHPSFQRLLERHSPTNS